MLEYLRRMALWASACGITRPWPFIDLAECVDPSTQIDKDLLERLDELIEECAINPKVAHICRNSVKWAEVRQRAAVVLPELDDPFEAIIALLECGGQFFTENQIALIGFGGIPFAGVAENILRDPMERLDWDYLNVD